MKLYPPSLPPLQPFLAPLFLLLLLFTATLISLPQLLYALGSGSTIAAVYGTGTVCGIVAGEPIRRIECYAPGRTIYILPNISYDAITAGRTFFCGLRSGGNSLLCWDTTPSTNSTSEFSPKRIYFSADEPLREISVGSDQVVAILNATNRLKSWRGMKGSVEPPTGFIGFGSISSGSGFSCGILLNSSRLVRCWGSNSALADSIEGQFRNISMSTIVAGGEHVCGFSSNGPLVCKGSNSSGQLDYPSGESFVQLALGFNFTCGIRELNHTVACWGGQMDKYTAANVTDGTSFELITAGSDFICGLSSLNFSMLCWGPGWDNNGLLGATLPVTGILPGQCVESSSICQCGIYPQSEDICSGSGYICRICGSRSPILSSSPPPPLQSPSSSSTSKPLRRGMLAFAIVGSVGAFAGICSIIYCLYMGICFGRKKIHNSVQPTITRTGSSNVGPISSSNTTSPPSRCSTIRRQGSRSIIMRRQRSGTSSTKHPERAEEFSFAELAKATNYFSLENKIGAGSFGVVYKGKLSDGREVAIKRGETSPKAKRFQEKESAFDSELAFLSRLHHKHLVRLVGYCEERDERLLVYEYMKNGALYDHLHSKNNVEKSSSVVNSWKVRIRIALDAARGIEYLHNYAVPPIIHRDIKSSNILLDSNWTARVSDFGLSLKGPESDRDFRPLKAAGTVGYIDPEYYGLNVLTAKSDVYGFGVVLLELLTGKRAIFKATSGEGNNVGGGAPVSVVDYAVLVIMEGELNRILDPRVGPPASNEAEGVELVAYTALHCVHLEGKDRPTMADIVANLERALGLLEETRESMSSASISIGSD